ncbi:MAG TPA: transglutaminase domain-containing protein [Anaeromyxobacter sp.]
MPALVLALAVTLGASPLPEGRARWRFELAGEHVGVAELAVSCAGDPCSAVWTSERRAPAEIGGRRSTLRIEADLDREGVWRGGRLRVVDEGGARKPAGVAGAFPASLAELVLARRVPLPPRRGWQSALPAGPDVCIDVFEETTGRAGRACAHRDGHGLAVNVLGVDEAVVPGADGFAASVAIAEQGARFVRDDEATAPRRAPRLNGSVVPGPRDPARAASFCGVPRDPDVDPTDLAFLPEPHAAGAGCVERTAAWLARAARAGLKGRTAVGVAWDGARFVWHAWAEVHLERGWIPVDPSFGERPARGPRFTLAVHAPGDEAARLRAGERILACWGRERVR